MSTPSLTVNKKPTMKEWVVSKIGSNPKLFGGDNGGNAITKVYLEEVLGQTNITDEMIRAVHSVARARNNFLSKYCFTDYRTKKR